MKIYIYCEFTWDEEKQVYETGYSESYDYEGEIALCKGGGGGGGDSQQTIRYAPYIEAKHQDFLNIVAKSRNTALTSSIVMGTNSLPYVCIKSHKSSMDDRPVTGENYTIYWAQAGITKSSKPGGKPSLFGLSTEDTTPEVWAADSYYTCASPFSGYTDIEVDAAFFGVGYLISDFPSLYDMYGKFMAGLDIETLWSQTFEDTVNSSVVNDLVAAQAVMMDDDIMINSLPRLQVGMRDMNSVMASSFVIGKSIIEDARVKALSLFNAQLKYNLIPYAVGRWQTHLVWNKGVVGIYAELMKFYFSTKTDIDEINYAMAAKNKLWPFTVLDFERAALGAMQGATNTKTDVAGASTTAKVISGALSGAAMGAMVGGSIKTGATAAEIAVGSAGTYAGWGGVVGAGLGIAAALTY